jgi:hypothetical protein
MEAVKMQNRCRTKAMHTEPPIARFANGECVSAGPVMTTVLCAHTDGKCQTRAKPATLSFTINAPLDPFGRGEHFEDPLYNWLEHQGAEILDGGGGTMRHDDGLAVSDFFVQFNGRSLVRSAIRFVRSLGVPIGSNHFWSCSWRKAGFALGKS